MDRSGHRRRQRPAGTKMKQYYNVTRPYYIDIVIIGELRIIYTNAKFHFVSNGLILLRDLRKIRELVTFKDG